MNAKVNKQLINDELELEPIRSKGRSKGPSVLQLILERLDKIDSRLNKLEENDKKIFDILNRNNLR